MSQKTDPLRPGDANAGDNPNAHGGGGQALPPTVRDPNALSNGPPRKAK